MRLLARALGSFRPAVSVPSRDRSGAIANAFEQPAKPNSRLL
jgi:hypothetical protein